MVHLLRFRKSNKTDNAKLLNKTYLLDGYIMCSRVNAVFILYIQTLDEI